MALWVSGVHFSLPLLEGHLICPRGGGTITFLGEVKRSRKKIKKRSKSNNLKKICSRQKRRFFMFLCPFPLPPRKKSRP